MFENIQFSSSNQIPTSPKYYHTNIYIFYWNSVNLYLLYNHKKLYYNPFENNSLNITR